MVTTATTRFGGRATLHALQALVLSLALSSTGVLEACQDWQPSIGYSLSRTLPKATAKATRGASVPQNHSLDELLQHATASECPASGRQVLTSSAVRLRSGRSGVASGHCSWELHSPDGQLLCRLRVEALSLRLPCGKGSLSVGGELLCGGHHGARTLSLPAPTDRVAVHYTSVSPAADDFEAVIVLEECGRDDLRAEAVVVGDADCGGRFPASLGEAVELLSPQYPAAYPNNKHCLFAVEPRHPRPDPKPRASPTLSACFLDLNFVDFNLGTPSPACATGDRLEVAGVTSFCGNRTGRARLRLPPQHGQGEGEGDANGGGGVRLSFISDGEGSGAGFRVLATLVPCPQDAAADVDQVVVVDDTIMNNNNKSVASASLGFPYPMPYPFPEQLPQCCGRVHEGPRLFLTSPGFPHGLGSPSDCVFPVARLSPQTCRIRIVLHHFLLLGADLGICEKHFLQVGERRLCGCQSRGQVVSYFRPDERIKLLRYHRHLVAKGSFIVEVLQEDCTNPVVPLWSRSVEAAGAVWTDGSTNPQWSVANMTSDIKRSDAMRFPEPPRDSQRSIDHSPKSQSTSWSPDPPGRQWGAENPQYPQTGHQNPQWGSGNPQPGPQNPQWGSGNPQPGPQNPQWGAGNPQPGPQNPQWGSGNPQPGPQNPQWGSGNPQPGPQNPQWGSGNPQPGPQNPQWGSGNPQPGPQNPQWGSGNPQPGPQNPQWGSGNPQPGPQNPQWGSQEPRPEYPQWGPRPGSQTPNWGPKDPEEIPQNPQDIPWDPQGPQWGSDDGVPLNCCVEDNVEDVEEVEVGAAGAAHNAALGVFPVCGALSFKDWMAGAAAWAATVPSALLQCPVGIFPPAKCRQLRGPTGFFASPLYPDNYPNNARVCYRIVRYAEQCSVQVSFLDFELEPSPTCSKDYVSLDGATRYCGSTLASNLVQLNFQNSPYVDILFITDSAVTARGFRASYRQFPCGPIGVPGVLPGPYPGAPAPGVIPGGIPGVPGVFRGTVPGLTPGYYPGPGSALFPRPMPVVDEGVGPYQPSGQPERTPAPPTTSPPPTPPPTPGHTVCGGGIRQQHFALGLRDVAGHNECVFTVGRVNQDICGLQILVERMDLDCRHEHLVVGDKTLCGRDSVGQTVMADFLGDAVQVVYQSDQAAAAASQSDFLVHVQQVADCLDLDVTPVARFDKEAPNHPVDVPPPACVVVLDSIQGAVVAPVLEPRSPHHLSCSYLFRRRPGRCSLHLDFHDFALATGSVCEESYLALRNHKYCGTDLLRTSHGLSFTGPTIELPYRLQRDIAFARWNVSYSQRPC